MRTRAARNDFLNVSWIAAKKKKKNHKNAQGKTKPHHKRNWSKKERGAKGGIIEKMDSLHVVTLRKAGGE